MLITTIEQFVALVPTAANSDFESLKPYLKQAEAAVKSELLGKDCFDHISALTENDELYINLLYWVANKGYLLAIPYLDLIQTQNGFAVVNNSNQAPASKERVDKLIQGCTATVMETTDILIDLIQENSNARTQWVKFIGHKSLTNCFFYTGRDYALYADTTTRAEFLKAKSQMLIIQRTDLAEYLSSAFVTELIEALRTNTLTDKNKAVVETAKIALVAMIYNNEEEAKDILEQLMTDIEADIDSYSAYKNSREYALKSATRYQNLATDGSYFMPGV